MFFQTGSITVSTPGGAVPLSETSASSSGVYALNGVVHLLEPGVYRLMYLVHFPVATRVSTALSLRLGDGRTLPGSICHVDKENPGQPFTAAGQAILKIGGEVSLTLSSARAFAMSGASAQDTMASISVVKLA